MPSRACPQPHLARLVVLALAVGACSAGPWTFGPGASASATTSVPPSLELATHETPAAATPSAPLSAGPSPSAVPSDQPGLTGEEWAALATPWGIQRATADAPAVTEAEAETVVRARYPGDRPLVWSGLVTVGDGSQLGWMVVLGIAPGQVCALHPGLLDRALEGGIVDAATGDVFFTMTCG